MFRKIFRKLELITIHHRLKKDNIQLGEGVIFKKMPLVGIHPKARLIIGQGTTINSDNSKYHLNMFAACKFLADRAGAVIEIGTNCRIHGSCLHAYKRISVGNNCLIAANCQIIDGNGHDLSFENTANRINTTGVAREVVIEDDVWLGTGVTVLPGVRIGKGSIVSAYSVVHKDIPPMVIAAGNPVKIIKDFNSQNKTLSGTTA